MINIYELEANTYHDLSIVEIIELIRANPANTYYKFYNNHIKNARIKINNEFALKTEFICHRINTISELAKIDASFGVELDIRDDHKTGKLILAHDPFVEGEYFEDYLKEYQPHQTLILNIKSERVELQCLELLNKYNISKYFFLDSSFPMIFYMNKYHNCNQFACRYSEFEPIENFIAIQSMISHVWVDCFTQFPLTSTIYQTIKDYNKKICIVSPELQKQEHKISQYRYDMIDNNISPDMICCKEYNIIHWL